MGTEGAMMLFPQREPTVPRYYFIVQSPNGIVDDDDGVALRHEAEARKYATQVIRDLKEDDPSFTSQGFELVVKDESGKELFVLSFDGHDLH